MGTGVWLDVPKGMERFAEIQGATRSEAGGWSVLEVDFINNPELWEFRRKESRVLQKTRMPSCPSCKKRMAIRPTSIGSVDFWRCHSYPVCMGTLPLEEWNAYIKALEIGQEKSKYGQKISPYRFLRCLQEIFLGSGLDIKKWFYSPKVGLGGRTPEQALDDGVDPLRILNLFILFTGCNKGEERPSSNSKKT